MPHFDNNEPQIEGSASLALRMLMASPDHLIQNAP